MTHAVSSKESQSFTSDPTRRFRWIFWILLVATVVLAGFALLFWLTSNGDADSLGRILADKFLTAAIVGVAGIALTEILKIAEARREKAKQELANSLERTRRIQADLIGLLRRMRAVHVRISDARRVMRAEKTRDAYKEQMRELMLVTPQLEEIREEVKVSTGPYEDADKKEIMCGIAQIVDYLDVGYDEYVNWCRRPAPGILRKFCEPWLDELIADRPSLGSRDPMDTNWAPKDSMPEIYENALTHSKGIMRKYAYGSASTAATDK